MRYCSLEQISREKDIEAGFKSDVYSTTIMMYEMFMGDNLPKHVIIHQKLDFTSNVWNEFSVEVKTFLQQVLIDDWKKRPSAEEILKMKYFQTVKNC